MSEHNSSRAKRDIKMNYKNIYLQVPQPVETVKELKQFITAD